MIASTIATMVGGAVGGRRQIVSILVTMADGTVVEFSLMLVRVVFGSFITVSAESTSNGTVLGGNLLSSLVDSDIIALVDGVKGGE